MIKRLFYWLQDLFIGKPLGGLRSPQWSKVRNDFLKKNPNCAICGKKGTLLKPNQIHHIQNFMARPDLELLTSNLLTGCREHHFWYFHLGSWKSTNENVLEDVAIWSKKIKNRPTWIKDKWVYPS